MKSENQLKEIRANLQRISDELHRIRKSVRQMSERVNSLAPPSPNGKLRKPNSSG
jgi:hypothetical protein